MRRTKEETLRVLLLGRRETTSQFRRAVAPLFEENKREESAPEERLRVLWELVPSYCTEVLDGAERHLRSQREYDCGVCPLQCIAGCAVLSSELEWASVPSLMLLVMNAVRSHPRVSALFRLGTLRHSRAVREWTRLYSYIELMRDDPAAAPPSDDELCYLRNAVVEHTLHIPR